MCTVNRHFHPLYCDCGATPNDKELQIRHCAINLNSCCLNGCQGRETLSVTHETEVNATTNLTITLRCSRWTESLRVDESKTDALKPKDCNTSPDTNQIHKRTDKLKSVAHLRIWSGFPHNQTMLV